MEEFAQKYDQIDTLYPDLPKWELECQRRNFADTYRRLVGVVPEERDRLRQSLTDLNRSHGNMSTKSGPNYGAA